MSKFEVELNPNILEWVLNSMPNDSHDSPTFQTVKQWLDGVKKPTFNQVEDISSKTHIPFGYFFLEKPPVEHLEIVEFRTVDSLELEKPSRDLIDTIDAMVDVQDWMSDYLKNNEFEKVPFIGKYKGSTNYNVIVDDIRATLQLEIDWFRKCRDSAGTFNYLKKRLSKAGVIVNQNSLVGNNTHRVLDYREFRAFTLIDEYAPLIFINASDYKNAKVFSLMHEAAHLWLGVDSLFNLPSNNDSIVNRVEQICNAVAAEILVPSELLKDAWNPFELLTKQIDRLSKYFRVSRSVVLRKALDNKLIGKETYDKEIGNIESIVKKKSGKSNPDYNVVLASKWDPRFVVSLFDAASVGQMPYNDLYSLTGTNSNTFSKLHSKMMEAVYE